ncbi:RRXRR domain-containing protein [Parasutterella excrementihominis]|uniref:RRXRR domain-containing protein n=1 Tax=Parasutterella excrementihominis TaxID=487175 RepID=UPI001F4F8C90|nr:RRXRR domain-containing protein [Parasutterella excrementihominis]
MRVFVLNKRGKPLMPCSPAKARLLLKEKKAIVKRRTPFTIQLTIATGETKQPVSLGVDAGYKHVGLSASTEKAELYASEVELRQDITDLLSARRALRQSRDADPSPALCGRWLKALRGRSGAVGLKPLPTLAKDHNRSKDRGDKLESIC